MSLHGVRRIDDAHLSGLDAEVNGGDVDSTDIYAVCEMENGQVFAAWVCAWRPAGLPVMAHELEAPSGIRQSYVIRKIRGNQEEQHGGVLCFGSVHTCGYI